MTVDTVFDNTLYMLGIHQQLEVAENAFIEAPEIYLAHGVDSSKSHIDVEILIDSEYSEEERADAIMKEIVRTSRRGDVGRLKRRCWKIKEEIELEESRVFESQGKDLHQCVVWLLANTVYQRNSNQRRLEPKHQEWGSSRAQAQSYKARVE